MHLPIALLDSVSIDFRFLTKKKLLTSLVGAVVVVILLVGIVLLFRGKNERNIHQAAIVANGLECAAIARYTFHFNKLNSKINVKFLLNS